MGGRSTGWTGVMNEKVAYKKTGRGPQEGGGRLRQPYIWPEDLFAGAREDGCFWTCVRTRPRWEKKFAGWLIERRKSCYLPVFPHETTSGRKRRTSELPLFPGFVFVRGDFEKKDFAQTGRVAYVLKPRCDREAEQLDRELKDVWQGLTSGLYVTPVQNLAAGERCRIAAGPLQGVEAKFERMGREGRLILQVEMMGGGVALEMPAAEVEVWP